MGGALHKFLHVRNAMQGILDHVLVFLRKPGFAGKLLYVISVSFSARHTSSGSMRLVQKTGIRKVGHHIADSCRTESLPAGARQGTRPHRLARGDESLDNRGQDLPLTISYGLSSLHIKYFCCRNLDWSFPTRPQLGF